MTWWKVVKRKYGTWSRLAGKQGQNSGIWVGPVSVIPMLLLGFLHFGDHTRMHATSHSAKHYPEAPQKRAENSKRITEK